MKNLFKIFIFSLTFSFFSNAYGSKSTDIILDVRTPAEYADVHLVGSINIDIKSSGFKTEIIKLDKTKSYKVYCRSGHRAGLAVDTMKSLGFKNVENVGGYSEASKKLNIPCEGKTSC